MWKGAQLLERLLCDHQLSDTVSVCVDTEASLGKMVQ
jgi:hypothetical protein